MGGRESFPLLKITGKVVLRVVPQLIGNFLYAQVCVDKQPAGPLVEQLKAIAERGNAVLFSEEVAEPAAAHADCGVVLLDGRLVVKVFLNERFRTLHGIPVSYGLRIKRRTQSLFHGADILQKYFSVFWQVGVRKLDFQRRYPDGGREVIPANPDAGGHTINAAEILPLIKDELPVSAVVQVIYEGGFCTNGITGKTLQIELTDDTDPGGSRGKGEEGFPRGRGVKVEPESHPWQVTVVAGALK